MSLFVSFEGPEGGGKTTQAQQLADALSAAGHAVVNTREPGGTPIGNQVRQLLLDHGSAGMQPQTEFLLFSASRAQLVREVIEPQLARGGVVLCDRFYDSSLAYQGYGHQLDLVELQRTTRLATGGRAPELTFLLDIDAQAGLQRRRAQGGQWNRLDGYALEFHERVRAGFLQLAAAEPARWVVLDAGADPAQLQAAVLKHVMARLAGAAVR